MQTRRRDKSQNNKFKYIQPNKPDDIEDYYEEEKEVPKSYKTVRISSYLMVY